MVSTKSCSALHESSCERSSPSMAFTDVNCEYRSTDESSVASTSHLQMSLYSALASGFSEAFSSFTVLCGDTPIPFSTFVIRLTSARTQVRCRAATVSRKSLYTFCCFNASTAERFIANASPMSCSVDFSCAVSFSAVAALPCGADLAGAELPGTAAKAATALVQTMTSTSSTLTAALTHVLLFLCFKPIPPEDFCLQYNRNLLPRHRQKIPDDQSPSRN